MMVIANRPAHSILTKRGIVKPRCSGKEIIKAGQLPKITRYDGVLQGCNMYKSLENKEKCHTKKWGKPSLVYPI